MEKEKIDFPEITDLDMSFGSYPEDWFKQILKKATDEGFTGGYSNSSENASKWEKRMSSLFYKGGSINLNKSLDPEFLYKGIRIFKCIAGSFNPKHEHKTAACSFILREIEIHG